MFLLSLVNDFFLFYMIYVWFMMPLEIFQELLEVLHGALPKMSLIASDFSYLPDVRILGDRAPLVSTKVHSDPCFYPVLSSILPDLLFRTRVVTISPHSVFNELLQINFTNVVFLSFFSQKQ